MPEPVPMIPDKTHPDNAENVGEEFREPPISVRIGERVLGFFSLLSRPAASLLSREKAVVEGIGAAVGRVLLGGVLIGMCILVTSIYSSAASIGRWGPQLPWDRGTEEGLMMIAWVITAGATLIISWTDWDRKWRVLGWLCFALVASGTLFSRGSQLGVLAILTGQFAIHWFIHAALLERDRRAEWERETERVQRNADRPGKHPNLAQQYGGHSGFSKSPDEEQS